jgi:urea-proton symporter
MSHYGIIIYALVLAAFCCILNAAGKTCPFGSHHSGQRLTTRFAGLNLTWLLTILAIIVGGGSIPVGLVLLWKRMSTVATIASPWIGLACGLIVWFVTTWKRSGAITVESTGNTINAVAGNVTSFGVGWILAVVLSFIFPAKYSSTDARHIERSNKIQGISGHPSPSESPAAGTASPTKEAEKGDPEKEIEPHAAPEPEAFVPTGNELVEFLEAKNMEPMDPVEVKKAEKLATGFNLAFFLIAVILVPFTLFGTKYIYSRSFFEGWVVVSFIWVWTSMVICVIYPVVESTGALRHISLGLSRDFKALFGGRKPMARGDAAGTA